MTRTAFTSHGVPVAIGRELGKGGEGSVFEVPALRTQVAKLYHKPLDGSKQAKLRFMASSADAQLLKFIAWPQDTLHASRGGPVVGFLMPRVGGDAIHELYSPAHRRQQYPKAGWDFLLYVARNVAASFETLHAHGHVIGDVNQNSFMVARDSKVVLIDSDSFQVNANGTRHLCEVGVAHFTPPELQSLPSFSGFTRTANHDNFGLALLIFHLLFGGRHPYSGVPMRSGVGDALEADIKNFRYAYARDNQARGFSPPPRSIPVSMLPDTVETMFHLAFTEKGAQPAGRPTAANWVSALDNLRGRLKKCGVSAMHMYPDHLARCPWCALDQQGVIYFVNLGTTFTATPSGFVLASLWAMVEAITPPPPLSIPAPLTSGLQPKPLPKGIPGKDTVMFLRVLVVLAVMLLIGVNSKATVVWLAAGVFGWFLARSAGQSARQAEAAARHAAQATAESEFHSLCERAKKEAGPEGFSVRKHSLERLKKEYEGLAAEEAEEIRKLHASAQQRQKEKFLESFFIDNASIPGVGPARKAALRSFGIETAADVTKHAVGQVRGFGESLTRAMLDWKASCERRFTFNPTTAVSAQDLNAVRVRFFTRRTDIERQLAAGPAELQRFCAVAASTAPTVRAQLDAAAKKLAQAQANLTVL